MKHFRSVHDVADLEALVQKGLHYKLHPTADRGLGSNKRLGCLFLNPSMRTRLSTQVAAQNLGLETVIFNVGGEGWALEFEDGAVMNGTTVEHIRDAAPIFGSYFDLLAIRTFPSLTDREQDYSEHYLNQFVKYAGIPVISLESATLHPLQSLTDLLTIIEVFEARRKPKVVLTWAPHVKALPQCVANSFAQWMTAWGGSEFVIAHPQGYALSKAYTEGAAITTNQEEALLNADFVYVKNWSAYEDYGKVLPASGDWMLTAQKLAPTREAKVMHCLPVRRNVELSDEILDGPNSIVTQQAGNRVWAAQAVLSTLLHG